MLTDWTLTVKNLFLPIFCKMCGCRLLTEEPVELPLRGLS